MYSRCFGIYNLNQLHSVGFRSEPLGRDEQYMLVFFLTPFVNEEIYFLALDNPLSLLLSADDGALDQLLLFEDDQYISRDSLLPKQRSALNTLWNRTRDLHQ